MSIFSDVRDFMKIGHPEKIRPVPTFDIDDDRLCAHLIKEEYREMMDAWAQEDMAEFADGIADLIYVLVFSAHAYGIPIEEVWDEVQRTNMAKFPDGKVLRRESDGKILKPEGWTPPDIKSILDKALANQCTSACPHGDRCTLAEDHDGGHNHRVCDCNEPNSEAKP